MSSAPDERAPSWRRIVLTAAIYAVAIVALVLFAPSGEHAFVYKGF